MNTLASKYRVTRKLAAGGMAEVYRAKAVGPSGFEKEVCLKRVLPHLARDPEFVDMFKAEARLAARLQHTNIVQIFDFGEEDGTYFIAMEYVDGRDLRRLLERAKRMARPLPPGLAAYIAHEAARGLAYAHTLTVDDRALGIVHRDVSPHNILVSQNGEVKVADFGIAKAASRATSTRAGVLKGKLAYMAPEQARGEAVDGRTDIFALGLILYEMLTGVRPFQAETETETLARVLQAPIPSPASHAPNLPDALCGLTMRALARDRDERFGSAQEMARDLQRFLFTLPPEEATASALGRFVRDLAGADDDEEPGGTILAPDSPYAATASAGHPAPVARPDEATRLQDDTVASAATSFTRTGVRDGPRWGWRRAGLLALIGGSLALAAWWWTRERPAPKPRRMATIPVRDRAPPQPPTSRAKAAPEPHPSTGVAPAGTPAQGKASLGARDAGTSPAAPRTTTTRARSRSRRSRPRARRSAPVTTSTVRVTAVPADALVQVDDQPARRAPFTLVNRRRGEPLALLARAAGHSPLSRRITPRRAHESVQLDLTPLPGRLRVTAIPWAEIFIDGTLISDMPQAGVRVRAGWRKVRLRNIARKYDRTFPVRVPPGGTARLVREIDGP